MAMTVPRLLAIMGSGEMAPAMTSVHQALLARVEGQPGPVVLLDTPFGFQENAAELAGRAVNYFAEKVGAPLRVATWLGPSASALSYEQMLAAVRDARYVFAGPGSPSYAASQWAATAVPALLREKLERGGCVTFASAAACTLGPKSLPVYEIYKVGQPLHWVDGLDLLSVLGLEAVVVPHYDNAEGGTHDTRRCYMGDRRLSLLEEMLPDTTSVLGVDEHTVGIFDLDARTVTVRGRGGVTWRHRDREKHITRGRTVSIEELVSTGRRAPAASGDKVEPSGASNECGHSDGHGEKFARCRDEFSRAVEGRDVDAAVAAALALESIACESVPRPVRSDAAVGARAALREGLVRLGDLARNGARDPEELVGPLVEAILALRRQARDERRFADADVLRDALLHNGVAVKDSPAGTTWELHSAAPLFAGR